MNYSLQKRAGNELFCGNTALLWSTVPWKHCLPHTLHYSTTNQLKLQCYPLVPRLRNNSHITGHDWGNEIITYNVTRVGVALEYLQQNESVLFAVFQKSASQKCSWRPTWNIFIILKLMYQSSGTQPQDFWKWELWKESVFLILVDDRLSLLA